MFKFFIFFTLVIFLNSKELKPEFFLEIDGMATDFVVEKERIFIASSKGKVDIFDISKKEFQKSIKVPNIKDFMQEIIESKVYSVDFLNEKVLILSQGENGGRDIFIYENGKLNNIVSSKDRLFIAKAKFLDDNHIIYALLSNQIFLYDIKNSKILKQTQVSQSSFSDFTLSSDKKSFVTTDESGVITQFESKSLKKLKEFKGQNVDRVFQVDIKKDTILGTGQDRRASFYFTNSKKSFYKSFDFLVYTGALSPSSKLACILLNENNDAVVFDIESKEDKFILTENRAILTKILFLNENQIVISSDDSRINFYNLN